MKHKRQKRRQLAPLLQDLPQVVLVRTLFFVGNVKEILGCGLVCNDLFRATSRSSSLWKQLACQRYGEELALQSESKYNGNWKELFLDDNKRDTFPLYQTGGPIYLLPDRVKFISVIERITWDRNAEVIKIYVDSKNDKELHLLLERHRANYAGFMHIFSMYPCYPCPYPLASTDTYTNHLSEATRANSGLHPFDCLSVNTGAPGDVLRRVIDPEDKELSHIAPHMWETTGPGVGWICEKKTITGSVVHIKGCITISDGEFYASGLFSVFADFDMPLFFVPQDGGLSAAFMRDQNNMNSTSMKYTADISPFKDDTPEKELSRWKGKIPDRLFKKWVA